MPQDTGSSPSTLGSRSCPGPEGSERRPGPAPLVPLGSAHSCSGYYYCAVELQGSAVHHWNCDTHPGDGFGLLVRHARALGRVAVVACSSRGENQPRTAAVYRRYPGPVRGGGGCRERKLEMDRARRSRSRPGCREREQNTEDLSGRAHTANPTPVAVADAKVPQERQVAQSGLAAGIPPEKDSRA